MKIKSFSALLACSLCLALVGCSDNDALTSEAGRIYQYSSVVPNEDGTTELVLDSLTTNVSTVSGLPSWCTSIAQSGTTESGEHPVLTITHTATDPNATTDAATAILTMENGSIVKLGLSQAVLYKSDNNGDNEAFISDWENQESVDIISGGSGTLTTKSINLPWASVTLSSIPREIAVDVKKEDGWSMAFCLLGKLENANYFGLYNKYLGLLRVFSYIETTSGSASDFVYEINMGNSANDQYHAAYYNALQYAIPVNHARLASNSGTFSVNGTRGQTFRLYSTPYNATSSSTLQNGWTAFDIDMSAYSPDCDFFGNTTDTGLLFSLKSWSNATVSMKGSLSANMAGTYDEPVTKTTTSGIGTVVNMLNQAGDMIDKCTDGVEWLEDKLFGTKRYDVLRATRATTSKNLCSAASVRMGVSIENSYLDEAATNGLRPTRSIMFSDTTYSSGVVDMLLHGNVALTGSITQSTSNNIPSVQFQKSEFLHTDNHLGEGTWSLADDPVVYLINNRRLSDARTYRMRVEADHTYKVGSGAQDMGLRMITFFDPSTVKVNINEDVYGKVSDVVVDTYYGVYPYSAPGCTNTFRTVAGIERPESNCFVDHNQFAVGSYFSWSTDDMIKQILPNMLNSTYYDEANTAELVSYTSNGRIYSYYGYKEDLGGGVAFMPDPQVYFPVSTDDKYFYDNYIPDFVVLVTVSFKAGGKTYVFSRNYLPKIKSVGIAANSYYDKELLNIFKNLQAFSNKCKNNEAAGTIANDASVEVHYVNGDAYVQKSLDLLNSLNIR